MLQCRYKLVHNREISGIKACGWTQTIIKGVLIMKKFKKAIMGVTALVMAFSMTALAACSNNKDPKDPVDPSGPSTPTPETPTPETPTPTTPTKSDAVKVLEALQKQSFKAADMEYTLDTKSMSSVYDCDEEGTILTGATKTTDGYHTLMNGKIKVNIGYDSLDFDASSHYYYEELDKDGKKVADSEEDEYGYTFSRYGFLFNAVDEDYKEITDFSSVTLSYGGELNLPPQVSALLKGLPASGAPTSALTPLSAFLNLAEEYDGATFADKKLKVNLNKVAYGLYNDVLKVVEGLNENTTVIEVIETKPVKLLIESLTYGMEAKDIMDQVAAMMGGGQGGASTLEGESSDESGAGMAMVGAIVAALPEAAAGESVYDYLVKVLNSTTFADAVLGAMGIQSPVSTSLGALKVSYVVEMVMGMMGGSKDEQGPSTGASPLAEEAGEGEGMSFADIKDMIKSYLDMITVTEDKVTFETVDTDGDPVAMDLTALELVFAVGDDYTVSSVTYSAAINQRYSYMGHGDSVGSHTNHEVEITRDLTATIALATEHYTLTDINSNNLELISYEYEPETQYAEIVSVNPSSPDKYSIYLGVTTDEYGYVDKVAAYTKNAQDEYVKVEGCESSGAGTIYLGNDCFDEFEADPYFEVSENTDGANNYDDQEAGKLIVTITYDDGGHEDSYYFAEGYNGDFRTDIDLVFNKTQKTSTTTVSAFLGLS